MDIPYQLGCDTATLLMFVPEPNRPAVSLEFIYFFMVGTLCIALSCTRETVL